MSKRAGGDLVEWAASQKRNAGANHCKTCEFLAPEVLEQVSEIAAAHREKRVVLSQSQLRRKLVDDYGYPLTLAALNNHLSRCAGGW